MAGWFIDSERRLRTFWRLSIFCVGYVIATVVFAIACAGVILLVALSFGKEREALAWLSEDQVMVGVVVSPPFAVLILVYVWALRRFLDKRDLASLGVRRPERRWTASVWVGLAAGVVPLAAVILVLVFAGALTGSVHGPSGTVFLLLVTLPFAAFAEELVTRGYILQNLVDVRRPVLGVIVSSVFFWLFHSLNPGAWATPLVSVNLLLAGVLLAFAYLLSRNLWFPTAMHYGWNALQGPIFGLPISGVVTGGWIELRPVSSEEVLLTGGAFGLEGSLSAVLLEIILIAAFAILLYRRRGSAAARREATSYGSPPPSR